MSLASTERAALCDEFTRVGPDAPTLCGDWTTRDLLTHLLVRERAPWAAPGILVPPLAPLTDRAMHSWDATPYAELIEVFRGGAPVWSPFHLGKVDAYGSAAEFFVHLEDVRRARPGWEPRDPDAARDAEVWTILTRIGRLLHRKSPVGVRLRTPDGRVHVAKPGPGVTLVGWPEELLLQAYGRAEAEVRVEGEPAATTAFEHAPRGF